MKAFKIFIVEDDPWYGEMLKYHLSLNDEYEISLYQTAKECLKNLHLKPNVVSIDYNLPDLNGEALFDKIMAQDSSIATIVISGQEEINVAVSLLKKGVDDYILKDDNTRDFLWNSILRLREKLELKEEVKTLKDKLESKFHFEKTIIGQSDAIKQSFRLIKRALKTNINVSVMGETGTGKELVAQAIHYSSDRSKKPFVAINMAAIPKELMESELFGHEKGAFTGAISRKIGKFEEANDGTLFLDEIAELDINMQVKLLRVLQEREIVRVGGNKSVNINARLITATHKNLVEEVNSGRFRKDLYYRIIGLPIRLPSLKERGMDVLILAKHFIELFSKNNRMKLPKLTEDAKSKLMNYHYPGNVRELKSILDLACVMTDDSEIKAIDITFNELNKNGEFNYLKSDKSLKEHTIDIIQYLLNKNNHNVVKVARILDIGKSTIYNLINSGEIKKPN